MNNRERFSLEIPVNWLNNGSHTALTYGKPTLTFLVFHSLLLQHLPMQVLRWSKIVPESIIIITIPLFPPFPNRRRLSRQPLFSLLVNMSQSQNMSHNKNHSERRETDGDAGPVEIARCRRCCEDLTNDKARAVAHAEDNAEGCGALEVAGEVTVEPDDAEAGLWELGQHGPHERYW